MALDPLFQSVSTALTDKATAKTAKVDADQVLLQAKTDDDAKTAANIEATRKFNEALDALVAAAKQEHDAIENPPTV